MAAGRLKKVRRIVEVQAELHRLAEWRLAHLGRQEDELREQQEELVRSLNADSALHGLFVANMARSLRRLAAETERVAGAREAQRRRVHDEAMRLKRTERVEKRLVRSEREAEEKRDLQAFLEGLANKSDASAT